MKYQMLTIKTQAQPRRLKIQSNREKTQAVWGIENNGEKNIAAVGENIQLRLRAHAEAFVETFVVAPSGAGGGIDVGVAFLQQLVLGKGNRIEFGWIFCF